MPSHPAQERHSDLTFPTCVPFFFARLPPRFAHGGGMPILPALDRSASPAVDRRRFVAAMTGGLFAAPLAAGAQQAGRAFRVGFVSPAQGLTEPVLAFSRSLRALGLIEGVNVLVDRQLMGGREDQYMAVLADLERRVDVIVVTGPPAALAAKRVVTKVPVIFAAVGDPVAIGLVPSLAKPGGNFTGVAFDVSPEIAAKRLGLLREVFPPLARVAALWSPPDPVGIPALRHLKEVAPRLSISVRAFDVI